MKRQNAIYLYISLWSFKTILFIISSLHSFGFLLMLSWKIDRFSDKHLFCSFVCFQIELHSGMKWFSCIRADRAGQQGRHLKTIGNCCSAYSLHALKSCRICWGYEGRRRCWRCRREETQITKWRRIELYAGLSMAWLSYAQEKIQFSLITILINHFFPFNRLFETSFERFYRVLASPSSILSLLCPSLKLKLWLRHRRCWCT